MPNKTKYNKKLKSLARQLRKDGTKGEAILWKYALRAKKMNGYQFNRQFPIGDYIVDFICRKLQLIIEIDGSTHNYRGADDYKKQKFLEGMGFTILRFFEGQVIYRIDDVVGEIYDVIEKLEREKEIPLNPPFRKGDGVRFNFFIHAAEKASLAMTKKISTQT